MCAKREVRINPHPDAILSVTDLRCIYHENTPDAQVALDGVSYVFCPQKIYCIIGDSGSGKSTLVTHFNGLMVSRMGTIWVKNFVLGGSKRKKIKHFKQLRKIISMVFQFPEYQLFRDTVERDVMFGPLALGASKLEAASLARKYLHTMGIDETYLDRSPFELSGGQKRRVAIAGILAIEPEIIVFDEPTAGLDPHGEQETIDLIRDAKKAHKTVLVITHQMEHVLELADEVIVMSAGKIIASGNPYAIFTDETLLKTTSIEPPPVIRFINSLVAKNPVFKQLYALAPRNGQQLADAINQVVNAASSGGR